MTSTSPITHYCLCCSHHKKCWGEKKPIKHASDFRSAWDENTMKTRSDFWPQFVEWVRTAIIPAEQFQKLSLKSITLKSNYLRGSIVRIHSIIPFPFPNLCFIPEIYLFFTTYLHKVMRSLGYKVSQGTFLRDRILGNTLKGVPTHCRVHTHTHTGQFKDASQSITCVFLTQGQKSE